MNANSRRQQLQWPPLLNLSKDYPHIDTTFSNVEYCNSPYINEMLQPLYRRKLDKKYVYDKYGNKYNIESSTLYRNGEALFNVEDRHFEREDVTDEFNKYASFDLGNDGNYAYTIFNDDDNTITVKWGNYEHTTQPLFSEGHIIETRTRITNTRYAHVVIYYSVGSQDKVKYIRIGVGNTLDLDFDSNWVMPYLKLNSSENVKYYTPQVSHIDPIIYISDQGFSIVSHYGYAQDSRHTGFQTYFFDGDQVKVYAESITPNYTTGKTSTTTTEGHYFYFTAGSFKTIAQKACIQSPSGIYYRYDEEGVRGEQIDIPTSYVLTDGKQNIEIDGIVYSKWLYEDWTYTLNGKCVTRDTLNWKLSVSDGITTISSAEDNTQEKLLSITHTIHAWEQYSKYITKMTITWNGEDSTIPTSFWNKSQYYLTRTITQDDVTISPLVVPNVFTDSGILVSLWTFQQTTTNLSTYAMTNGNYLVGTGRLQSISGNTYTCSYIDYMTVRDSCRVARSNSISCEQNIIYVAASFSNTSAPAPANFTPTSSESTNARYVEIAYGNNRPMRFYPGSRRSVDYNYYGDYASKYSDNQGQIADDLILTPTGFRVRIGNTPWNWLVNLGISRLFVLANVSYSESPEEMGTTVATWNTMDRSKYACGNADTLIYHDDSNKYWKVSIKEGAQLSTLVEDRYIAVNTTSFWNLFDSELGKPFHYATDYNQRLDFGTASQPTDTMINSDGYPSLGRSYCLRAVGNGINPLYVVYPRLPVMSVLQPQYELYRILVGQETVYNSVCPESNEVQPVDVFYSDVSETGSVFQNLYRYSIYPFATPTVAARQNTLWFTYGETVSATIKPLNIFSKVVTGAGNNDAVQEGNAYFTLLYYDNKPLLAYNNLSANGYDVIDAFFVIQGQFYSVINEKIYSMVYSGGTIQSREAIVDIRGLKYIGGNPMIAFFWSPSMRAIYSFTGDANLSLLFNSSKFSRMGR